MFKNFQQFFDTKVNTSTEISLEDGGFNTLLEYCGGMTFGDGLYRLLEIKDIPYWNKVIAMAFPSLSKVNCFGYDWLGRLFASNHDDEVLMFEPGTGEILHLGCNFYSFHEQEIPRYHEACLASNFFNEWREYHGELIGHDQCVGYIIPLFLGGEDVINNLELTSMDVYWHISSLLIKKISNI